jgi:hypothetical protein
VGEGGEGDPDDDHRATPPLERSVSPTPDWHEAIDATLGPSAWFDEHGTSESPRQSIGRWRRDLGDDELSVVEEICAVPMKRFGYPLIGSSGQQGRRGPRRLEDDPSEGGEASDEA